MELLDNHGLQQLQQQMQKLLVVIILEQLTLVQELQLKIMGMLQLMYQIKI
jgi:hypothetical protein